MPARQVLKQRGLITNARKVTGICLGPTHDRSLRPRRRADMCLWSVDSADARIHMNGINDKIMIKNLVLEPKFRVWRKTAKLVVIEKVIRRKLSCSCQR